MQRIIKNNQIVDETWHLLPKETSFDELTNCDDYIVPLQMWRDHAHVLKARDGGLGVWLDSDQEAEEIGEDVQYFQVIALNFPPSPTGAATPTRACCVTATASRASCVPLVTYCATSCSTWPVAVSMHSPSVPTRTRKTHCRASRTSR